MTRKIPALIPILPSLALPDKSNKISSIQVSTNTASGIDRSCSKSSSSSNKKRKLPLPYIPLPLGGSELLSSCNKEIMVNTCRRNKTNDNATKTIGRAQLLLSTASACQCLTYVPYNTRYLTPATINAPCTQSKSDIDNNDNHERKLQHQHQQEEHKQQQPRNKERLRVTCDECKLLESWVCRYISKQMIKIEICQNYYQNNNNNNSTNKHETNESMKWKIHCIGKNSSKVVQIFENSSSRHDKDDILDQYQRQRQTQQRQDRNKHDNNENQPFIIHIGSIIRFQNANYDKHNEKKSALEKTNEVESSTMKHMEFKVDYVEVYSRDDNNGENDDYRKSRSEKGTCVKDRKTTSQEVEQNVCHHHQQQQQLLLLLNSHSTPVHNNKNFAEDLKVNVKNCNKIANKGNVHNNNNDKTGDEIITKKNLHQETNTTCTNNNDNDRDTKMEDYCDEQSLASMESIQDNISRTTTEQRTNVKLKQSEMEIIELLSSPEDSLSKMQIDDEKTCTSNQNVASNINVALDMTNEADDNTSPSTNNPRKDISIYFLHRGRSMSKSRIEFLQNALMNKIESDPSRATKRIELNIMNHFDQRDATIPNYIVLDGCLTIEYVSFGLGFATVQEMVMYFKKNVHIQMVKPDWVIQTPCVLERPTMDQTWTGVYEMKHMMQESKEGVGTKPSDDGNTWLKRRRRSDQFPQIETISSASSKNTMIQRLSKHRKIDQGKSFYSKNQELSAVFQKISKLYKDMPLDNFDEWRSYSYNAASMKLKYLDFPVSNDEETLRKLSSRKGFGQKFMRHVREFLKTGKVQLVTEFENDPMRLHVRNMIKIWGIGSKKALELVKLGHTDINSVREALKNNELDIDKNARIGVQFYEDFQEKMDRVEVGKIGEIVRQFVRRYFLNAEVTIMGSYRRGSERCGDVDVLITHPKFVNFVPKGSVDDLVERLREEGHISHHLTSVNPINREIFYQKRGNFDDVLINASKKAESYMGVFVSPTVPNKHRRIDIKFYPYRERAYASLYFTGNGWFNRAMRWYAKSKKKMKLTDKGLYPNDSEKRIKAKSEEEIFELLDLVYKSPQQRDCSDALVQKDQRQCGIHFDIGLDHSDFQAESKLVWVD